MYFAILPNTLNGGSRKLPAPSYLVMGLLSLTLREVIPTSEIQHEHFYVPLVLHTHFIKRLSSILVTKVDKWVRFSMEIGLNFNLKFRRRPIRSIKSSCSYTGNFSRRNFSQITGRYLNFVFGTVGLMFFRIIILVLLSDHLTKLKLYFDRTYVLSLM